MATTINSALKTWVRGTQGCEFARRAAQALTLTLPRYGEGTLYRFPVAAPVAAPIEGYECSDFEL